MVVLGASIVTKTGKVLVSRQFVDMTRIRIEGLLAAFPKLVSVGKQHTYVDTETVRYVYQPMEGLYLLLITNKASNIIEDLETLRLLSKVVPDYVSPIEEETIGRHAFDLLFAFDEVIAFGHKENITVSQVRQNTEMESHEEKLHRIIIQNKINETKDVMKRKANEIDKAKMESRKAGGKDMFKTMMPGPEMGMDSGIRMAGNDGDRPSFSSSRNTGASKPSRPTGAGKGMVLGKAKKTSDFLESLRAEGEAVDDAPAVRKPGARAPAASAPTPSEPVTIDMEEKLSVVCNKEGGLENLEVQGTMALQVLSEEAAHIQVQLDMGPNAGLQFKTHPNIDKALYSSQSVLGLKDPSRPFPTGTTLPVLKWRLQSRDEELMPISINCWPTKSGSETYVNIEYESGVDYDLQNVCIAIPGVLQAPQVNQVDGDWQFDSRQHILLWRVDLIDDSNRSGSMEFVVPGNDSEAFFPVQVSFSSSHIIADVALASVTSAQTRAPVQFRSSRTLIADNYEVVH